MDHTQLPLFDPNSIAYGNPGFTSPGFQLQLPSSRLEGQQQLQTSMTYGDTGLFLLPETQLQLSSSGLQGQQLLQSNLGFNNGFDAAGSAFDRMFQQINSGKRTNPGQFLNDDSLPLHQQPSTLQQSRAPGWTGNTDEAIQSRLRAYERRVNLLTEKCNRYENDLLQYTTPDPKTGKLPMQALKDEITYLRQSSSGFEAKENQYKAQLKDWQTKYSTVATLYERLRVDFERMRVLAQSKLLPPTPESLAAATPVAGSVAERFPERSAEPVAGPVDGLGFSNEANPIDLTTDDNNDAGTTTVSFNDAPNPQSSNLLTTFRRNFHQKELKWLQPAHPSDALQDLYDKLNPRDKEGYVDYGFGSCYEMVETQKRVRRALGGAFNQPPAPRREQPFCMPGPPKPTTPKPTTPPKQATTPNSTTSSKKQSSGSSSGGKKRKLALMTPDEIFAEDPTKYHISQEELDDLFEEMEASAQQDPPKDPKTDEDSTEYHGTDEELARMLEDEMMRMDQENPPKDATKDEDSTEYHVTDEELAQMLEDEMMKTVEQDPPKDSAKDDDLDSLFEE